MIRFAIVVLVGASRIAHAQCDPYSSQQPIEIPKALLLEHTCGNGRIDSYATSCNHVRMGGCGQQAVDRDVCTKEREVCDGRALDHQTCKTLGFSGGKLGCGTQCMTFDTHACTLCPKGGHCTERADVEYAYLRVMVQGEHVRVYWVEAAKNLHVAEVELATGKLIDARTISPQPVVVAQVGASAIGLAGTRDRPEVLVANGDVKLVPGLVDSALLVAFDQPLAVLYAENAAHERKLRVIDETGAEHAPTALFARDLNHELLLQPLAPGAHHLRWDAFETDFTAKPGDALVVVHDAAHASWPGVSRDGAIIDPFAPKHVATAVVGVELDHQALVVHHPYAPPPKPTPLLGELAYRDGPVPPAYVVAQTATLEIHAAVIWQHFAIAVGARDH